ncbi:MAG TPA: hypothetical protein VEE84_02990, partial [Burkholderiaceae bacterium]|nr:hypothetical protein [Burkholderiaceae bacterium]
MHVAEHLGHRCDIVLHVLFVALDLIAHDQGHYALHRRHIGARSHAEHQNEQTRDGCDNEQTKGHSQRGHPHARQAQGACSAKSSVYENDLQNHLQRTCATQAPATAYRHWRPNALYLLASSIRMNRPARRIDQILTDSAVAAALLGRIAASREAARIIAPICAEIAPDFDPFRPGSCDLRERELRIWLRSSAQSTKLRQATPRLLAALQRQGLEVNEIKVGVQPRRVREHDRFDGSNSAQLAREVEQSKAITPAPYIAPLEFSRQLVLTLPDSPLRRAVAALGKAMAARLARMRESNQPFYEKNGKEGHASAQAKQEDAAGPLQVTRLPADKIGQNANND